jgi:hypothetical protein
MLKVLALLARGLLRIRVVLRKNANLLMFK